MAKKDSSKDVPKKEGAKPAGTTPDHAALIGKATELWRDLERFQMPEEQNQTVFLQSERERALPVLARLRTQEVITHMLVHVSTIGNMRRNWHGRGMDGVDKAENQTLTVLRLVLKEYDTGKRIPKISNALLVLQHAADTFKHGQELTQEEGQALIEAKGDLLAHYPALMADIAGLEKQKDKLVKLSNAQRKLLLGDPEVVTPGLIDYAKTTQKNFEDRIRPVLQNPLFDLAVNARSQAKTPFLSEDLRTELDEDMVEHQFGKPQDVLSFAERARQGKESGGRGLGGADTKDRPRRIEPDAAGDTIS